MRQTKAPPACQFGDLSDTTPLPERLPASSPSQAERAEVRYARSDARTGRVDVQPINLAILMAMTSAAEHMPLADVKNRLSEVVDRLEREHGRVVITKHGPPAAVVMSVEDLESLEESLDILSDPKLVRRVRRAQTETETGKTEALSKGEALALIRRQG